MTIAKKKREFNRTLFRWHRTHYRDMPWRPKFPDLRELETGSTRVVRRTHDPYRILISEIMLQQTQVDRVRGKYDEFLKKFPSIKKLAHAPLGDVLRVWSGLGYNRRARYLHECAKRVVAEYGGKFPHDFDELKKLPGIGLSTAGALLAFSFGKDEPMVDTNIRRILARVFFKKHIPSDKELYVFAKQLIPRGKGATWNYAMLDLGATRCTARGHPDTCPLMKLHGAVGDFQYKKPQKKFAGSNRFYRGQILKALTKSGAITTIKLSKQLGIKRKQTNELVSGLKQEHLVVLFRGKAALPS